MVASQPSAAAPAAESDELIEELIHLLSLQARRVPAPVFLCSLLVAAIAFGRSGGLLPWLWLTAVACILAIRWKTLGTLPASSMASRDKLRLAVALSAANGLVQGASNGFGLILDVPERAVQSIVLLGLCAGSVATTGGYRPAFLAFVVPTLVPLAMVWALRTPGTSEPWTEICVAALLLMFGLVLLSLAKDAFFLFQESFRIRQEQISLNHQLRVALQDAETANRTKTRFLASASHDLRQPMHTLSLFSAALTMRPLDTGTRQIAVHMNTALQTLGEQLDALLDVSKLDAGVIPVRRTVFSLSRFLQGLEVEYRPHAEGNGLRLIVQCEPAALCEADEQLLGRIVRNLLENAIKYTPTGEVQLLTLSRPLHWVVVVKDTGIGIPESEHHRVFEEFYQLDNPERDRSRGLGLGLSIVRRLADLLKIEIELSSSPGRGTEFSVAIPKGRHLSRELTPTTEFAESSDCDSDRLLQDLRILVLDDEEAVRKGMETLLQAFGCHVDLAGCLAEAMALSHKAVPDILLVDLRLRGGKSGIAAIRALRAARANVPAILISGDTAPDRLREAHDAGIRMLHKPTSAEVLRRALILEILEGRAQHGSEAVNTSERE